MRDQLTTRFNEATGAVSDGYEQFSARVDDAAETVSSKLSENYDDLLARVDDVRKNVAGGYAEVADQVLDFVVDTNRKAVEATVSSADRVIEALPEMPWADRLPTFPTPAETGDRYLELVDQLASVNRDVNQRFVRLLETDLTGRREPTSGAGSAATSSTKKSSAKRGATKKRSAKKRSMAKTAAKPAPASA